jgi:hypothetical protein
MLASICFISWNIYCLRAREGSGLSASLLFSSWSCGWESRLFLSLLSMIFRKRLMLSSSSSCLSVSLVSRASNSRLISWISSSILLYLA